MLSIEQIETNRERIITELRKTNRKGIEDLIKYMDEEGFFAQASSTKYHQSYKGGNAEHSLQVFMILDEMNKKLNLGIEQDSIIISALLHDICKTDCYIANEDGTFSWNVNSKKGHGLKSVKIISKFIKLKEEEADAITYHMGAYEKTEFNWNDLSNAYRRNKLSYYIHVADMRSSYGI